MSLTFPMIERRSTATPPKLLEVRDAAELLRVCEKTVYNLTKRGQLAAVRIGTRVLYDPRDLNLWIENGKTNTGKCSTAV